MKYWVCFDYELPLTSCSSCNLAEVLTWWDLFTFILCCFPVFWWRNWALSQKNPQKQSKNIKALQTSNHLTWTHPSYSSSACLAAWPRMSGIMECWCLTVWLKTKSPLAFVKKLLSYTSINFTVLLFQLENCLKIQTNWMLHIRYLGAFTTFGTCTRQVKAINYETSLKSSNFTMRWAAERRKWGILAIWTVHRGCT